MSQRASRVEGRSRSLRGIAREHLTAQLKKPWARKLEARFRKIPEVFLGSVRTIPAPTKPGAAVEPLLHAIAQAA